MDKKESLLYEFDRFCLDASERILLYDMQEVPLTPKVFETLLLLVENSGHVVGKEELLKTIWPDSIVEESSLSQNIFHLRKALGDGSDGRRFIETIPKRGYKFIALVKVVDNKIVACNGLPYHSVTIEATLKERNESHTHRQEEVLIQTGPRSTPSTFHLNLPLGRKPAVIVIILMLVLGGGVYLCPRGCQRPSNISGKRPKRIQTANRARRPSTARDEIISP
jgi:DNA-binding winged helix-turn-helix (wHTH) protein